MSRVFGGNRDWRSSQNRHGSAASGSQIKGSNVVVKDLTEVLVAPDSYQVSPEPVLLIAELQGALALCLHDEARGVGGLLHLRFVGGQGSPAM